MVDSVNIQGIRFMSAKLLRIAAAQLKSRKSVAENLEIIRGLIADAARKKCDVVLFPECAVTGYNVDFCQLARAEVEDGLKSIAGAARVGRINVLVGSPTFAGGK